MWGVAPSFKKKTASEAHSSSSGHHTVIARSRAVSVEKPGGRPGRIGNSLLLVLYRMRHNIFFSSRRRHTRLQGDWSSDVCSSDLCRGRAARVAEGNLRSVGVLRQ